MYYVAKPWMNEKVFQYCEWNCDAMYDKCALELFVSMTQKVSQCMNDSKMNGYEWWKMMNVTDVHACYELQYEKENKAQRNDKCEKCKGAVAPRYVWKMKYGKEMCWKTKMTNVVNIWSR